MANYFKRILLVKPIEKNPLITSAVALKAESCYGGATLTLDVKPKHNFALGISTGGDFNLLCEESTTALDLSQGFSAGVFLDERLIAYGSSIGQSLSQFISDKDNFHMLREKSAKDMVLSAYDDEQISTFNYYDNQPISEDCNANKTENDWNVKTEKPTKNLKTKEDEEPCIVQDEKDFIAVEEQNYYQSVQDKLESALKMGTREHCLEEVIPSSTWVRLNYSSSSYYVLGVIKKNEKPRYVCYGVPGEYKNPPKKLEKYCCFIPSSLFRLSGSGYFVMFQCAITGEAIIPKLDIFGL